jgi:hypothetical protein
MFAGEVVTAEPTSTDGRDLDEERPDPRSISERAYFAGRRFQFGRRCIPHPSSPGRNLRSGPNPRGATFDVADLVESFDRSPQLHNVVVRPVPGAE